MDEQQEKAGEAVKRAYERVCARIAGAGARSGRGAGVGSGGGNAVKLVAVTKYASLEQVEALLALGHRDLGESRVGQLCERAAGLGGVGGGWEGIGWHMIGHLQRNKARDLMGVGPMVHSVDSERLVNKLQQESEGAGIGLDVLVQVNISGEDQKHGVSEDRAAEMVDKISGCSNLRIRGLMTMAPYSDDQEDARPVFARCRSLFEKIGRQRDPGEGFDVLSMGMSGDFEVAIEEGANVVRVGGALFAPEGG